MTIQSNLYVEKIIGEHPIAVWMLNEKLDYLSLLTETNRHLYSSGQWTITGGTASLESTPPEGVIFADSSTNKITGSSNVSAIVTDAVGNGTIITYTASNSYLPGQTVDITGLTITTGDSLNLNNAIIDTASATQFTVINPSIGTATSQSGISKAKIVAKSVYSLPTASMNLSLYNFCISGYLYVASSYITSFLFGYQYTDPIGGEVQYIEKEILIDTYNRNEWIHFSNTFDQPPSGATNIKMTIRAKADSGGSALDYLFYINGLNIGQWSEDFNLESLGVTGSAISSDIALPNTLNVIPANAYGSTSKNAYYLSNSTNMYAKNFGVPLVYGSNNVTKLYPNEISGINYPSIIFPGYGFLNASGKYNEYTAEMWISINSDAVQPRRIFGPISSTDGLYVEGGFLTFVIGKKFASHFVGEWFRPMLIHIRLIRDNVSILLNGEEVINISFVENDLSYPSEFNELNKSQNWLGFYSYTDIHPFSIDSFAIYSYIVPNEVAKRRFVWGQGVTPPELENAFLNSTTAYADYSFSKYAVNYNYPDFANWKQGFFSNVEANQNVLTLPNYSLPTFSLGTKTKQEWYDDMQILESLTSEKYFTFRPNSSWNTETCYIEFNSLNILNENLKSFYGIFETDGSTINEVLFKIINSATSDYLIAKISNTSLTYTISLSGVLTTIATKTIVADQKFAAGINIDNLSSQNINGIASFFANLENLKLIIGGDKTTTFIGKLYSFGFDSAYNNKYINSLYNTSGIFNSTLTDANTLYAHTCNYDLIPIEKYNTFFADIAISGYWEDYVPLSYFAKYIKGYDGDNSYDLDQIQFNVDYPEPIETNSLESISSWTYQDLLSQYTNPDILTYEDLANSYYTTWENYEDLSQSSTKYFYYDTSGANVRTYVSFQKIIEGANNGLADFTNLDVARSNGVLDVHASQTNWESTAFEVVDGTVILPPQTYSDFSEVDFNDLALVTHVNFRVDGILHNPVRLRDLELASQVYERTKFTEIGTKYGVPVYPYHKTGLYYDFKGENPIEMYKDSTPHLFLTRHSGWRMKGNFSANLDRGIAIPVNTEKNLNLKLSSLQLWIKFADREFPNVEIKILSIAYKTGIYDFYLTKDSSGQRGIIYAKDRETDVIETSFEYHLNGVLVDSPYIVNEEWYCLGIAFTELIDFSGYAGRITLNGPMTYNNISYATATNLEQEQRVNYNTWSEVSLLAAPTGWDYWENSFTWQSAYIVSVENFYDIDPSDIYARYVGTNRIVIDDNTDGILINPDKIRVYGDVSWSTLVKTPV